MAPVEPTQDPMSTGMGSLLTALAGLVAGLTTHIPKWFRRNDGPDRVVDALEKLGKQIIDDNCETRDMLREQSKEVSQTLQQLAISTAVLIERSNHSQK